MVHLGRYGYPDERNFVANLLPSMTFLLNWKFLRKSLFYGFFSFFYNFFQLVSTSSPIPRPVLSDSVKIIFSNFSSFFFVFFFSIFSNWIPLSRVICRINCLAFTIVTVPRTSKSVKNWAIYGQKKVLEAPESQKWHCRKLKHHIL